MDVMKLMVALAGWISRQQEDVIDYATTVSDLVDYFVTTTGMPHEIPTISIFGHYAVNVQRFSRQDRRPHGQQEQGDGG